jgi:hypothetical protein
MKIEIARPKRPQLNEPKRVKSTLKKLSGFEMAFLAEVAHGARGGTNILLRSGARKNYPPRALVCSVLLPMSKPLRNLNNSLTSLECGDWAFFGPKMTEFDTAKLF